MNKITIFILSTICTTTYYPLSAGGIQKTSETSLKTIALTNLTKKSEKEAILEQKTENKPEEAAKPIILTTEKKPASSWRKTFKKNHLKQLPSFGGSKNSPRDAITEIGRTTSELAKKFEENTSHK